MIQITIQNFKETLNKIFLEKKLETCVDFELKQNINKWSKKEELGHLIDSARYNLQRFTESVISDEVYKFIAYDQNKLVIINKYQSKDKTELINLFIQLNKQIVFVVKNYKPTDFQRKIITTDNEMVTLEFWVQDYINHFFHHLNKILQ